MMANGTLVYEDRWGSIIDRPDSGYLEIRWYDTTRAMTKADFEAWLTTFAGEVERYHRPGVLVDGTIFLMDPSNSDGPWRDAHIVPRYNAAGIKKFAFQFPEGMPAIGSPPAIEPPATYLTGYFGRRNDALAWLASTN
jgi:hypothetical protein